MPRNHLRDIIGKVTGSGSSYACLALILSLCLRADVYAQNPSLVKRYIASVTRDTADVSRPQALVYPTFGYSPETGIEVGLSGLLLFYHHKDTSNRLSEVTARAFYTLENQYGAFSEHALYADQDRWFFLGEVRFQDFPLAFYGIGPDTEKDREQLVESRQLMVKERVLRKIHRNIFFGVEAEYSKTSDVTFLPPKHPSQLPEEIAGQNGFSNFALGLGLVLDSRHNVLNVRDGYFSELAVLQSIRNFGSTYDYGYLSLDNRYFKSFHKDRVLALQGFYQRNWGDTPFNQLPQLGGPNLLRGYYLGRFRDKELLAIQAEYRYLPLPLGFTERIGAAGFASAGTVGPGEGVPILTGKWKTSAGMGLRVLLFPKKDIYVRWDFAFTNEGQGMYIYIGEAY
ncbi:BamA/TamA family outer membrane protein [Negadavirga shengliensis]|uniref:BamA/TamA family outer membrane protein n=1 Tax=Negadavirga shengliensis TaxID=1389218 RepID=A0ABV9T357_9BACT